MRFDLAAFKQVSGRLEVDDLDWAAFADSPLGDDELRCVRYMHDVEHHTSCYLRNLLNTRAHADPEISTFLTLWSFEELWHGEALAAVLAAHGEPAGTTRIRDTRNRLRRRMTVSPLLWMAISAATPHFLAVHMTVGVVNEWTTQAGYARLAARAGHPVLTDLLRRIMRQEGRHIDFYLTGAREHLVDIPAAQRVTRTVMAHVWRPVGAGVMPAAETAHLVRYLFGDTDGRAMAARIDRRVDRLPGLGDLRLMARSVRRHTSNMPAAPKNLVIPTP